MSAIIDKVRKLLRLADSPNANEAAAAAAKAQSLIDEHNLNSALLALDGSDPEPDEPIENFARKGAPLDSGKQNDTWRWRLDRDQSCLAEAGRMRGAARSFGVLTLPFTGSTDESAATSREAGPSFFRAHDDRKRILAYLRQEDDGGATDDEIQQACRIAGDSERPRRVELARAGCIAGRDNTTRRTRTGRAAVVWYFVKDLP